MSWMKKKEQNLARIADSATILKALNIAKIAAQKSITTTFVQVTNVPRGMTMIKMSLFLKMRFIAHFAAKNRYIFASGS